MILDESGRTPEAKAILVKLLSGSKEFRGRTEAEQLLVRLD
jgi:hypothetical protein